ncbi:MAG: AsmA family protein [Cyclobacteriaceae bacterium]
MKKVFIVLASLLGLILLAAVLLPIIFKDDIKAAIDKELDNALNAEIYYSAEDLSLSLFKSFPDFSVTVGNFGIVGLGDFAQDTLLSVSEFNLTLDIMSVIDGEQIKIIDVSLVRPDIKVLVLENGSANYDIAKPSEEVVEDTEEPSAPLNIQIQSWTIQDANLIYDDQTLPMVMSIGQLNHKGSGDFAQDIFDMVTTTSIGAFTLSYDNVEYISDKMLNADLTMAMDFTNMKFTFKENKIAMNDFAFGFDGYVSMPAEDIDMEITYGGKDINLKSILSLIPGTYQEYLDGVKATGQVNFDGIVSGTYNDNSMPVVQANFGIVDGKVDYSDFPAPMEEIQVNAKFDYPSADLRESSFLMDKFHMKLDGEEFSTYLLFKDFEDYFWDFRLDGNIDLEKITKVIQLEDMTLKGHANAKLATSGRMSDLDAERYDQLPTSGILDISDFYYESVDLPQGFGIANAKLTFDPEVIRLARFEGNAGKTDLNMDGEITNYLQYALADSAMLYGKLNFNSSLVDANEWMTEDTEEEEPEDTTALEVVRIPENIDFILASRIDEILYDNYVMEDFKGQVIVREGAVKFKEAGFNMLDGEFVLNGSYDSKSSLEKPLYDFDFAIKQLSIASAFTAFTSVQRLVPVAEKMQGKFSTDFKVNGSLGSDMMPLYEDLHGAGLISIAQASLKDVKLLSAVSNVSKLNQGDGEVSLKDVIMSAEIREGRLFVEPFDLTIGGKKATVGGSTGIDGSLDYLMSMDVPAGQVGDALSGALSSVAGLDNVIGKDVALNIGILGSYNDPKVSLLSAKSAGSTGGSVKAALEDKAKAKVGEKKEEAKEVIDTAKDSVNAVVDEKKEEIREEVKEEVDKAKEEVKDKAKDAVKDLFGKKKKDGGF